MCGAAQGERCRGRAPRQGFDASVFLAGEAIRYMLWQRGGYKVTLFGPKEVCDAVTAAYSAGGKYDFEVRTMPKIYGTKWSVSTAAKLEPRGSGWDAREHAAPGLLTSWGESVEGCVFVRAVRRIARELIQMDPGGGPRRPRSIACSLLGHVFAVLAPLGPCLRAEHDSLRPRLLCTLDRPGMSNIRVLVSTGAANMLKRPPPSLEGTPCPPLDRMRVGLDQRPFEQIWG